MAWGGHRAGAFWERGLEGGGGLSFPHEKRGNDRVGGRPYPSGGLLAAHCVSETRQPPATFPKGKDAQGTAAAWVEVFLGGP